MRAVSDVRVRFAPSPTGYLHLGSARTALFNWLWARHVQSQGGSAQFLLRIEDTDQARSQPELIEVIFEAMTWLGLDWDGEPVFQSANAERHAAVIDGFLASGLAYRCDCTQEQVAERNKAAGGPPGYDGFCRDRGVSADEPHVVRFMVPDGGTTAWTDLVRGDISFENRNLEDFVLRRRDGSPMFLVANAVDDLDMGITHVIRGEDLINVTPKTILLREALGESTALVYGHLPLIVNEQRKKLSKRQGDVAIEDYRGRGFLPQAMTNYLALLGWGPPDGVEVRPIEEIIDLFEMTDVNPSSAMFDVKKLESINGEWIRRMAPEDFEAEGLALLLDQPWGDRADRDTWSKIAPEMQTRLKVMNDLPDQVDFLFLAEPAVDPAAWEKAVAGNDAAPGLLDAAIRAYDGMGEWTAEALHAVTMELAEAAGLKLGKAQAPIRVALTGRSVGPPLFESMVVLGRDRTLERLRSARAALSGSADAGAG